MKHFVTRASIFTMFGFVWITFSLSAFADAYDQGFSDGCTECSQAQTCPTCEICEICPPQQTCPTCETCETCPQHTCPTCPSDRYNDGYNAGLGACPAQETCQTCPAQETCQTCQTCPAQQTCPTCPAQQTCPTCEICPAQQTCPTCSPDRYDDGVIQGKKQCQENPVDCFGLIYYPVPDVPIKDTYCDNKTKNCFSVQNGLYLSSVYDENDTNTPVAKDVQMDILIGGDLILFVLKPLMPLVDSKHLVVEVTGEGEGKVFSDPMGIICDKSGGDCEENYDTSTKVQLYAVPKNNKSAFKAWSGDCKKKTNPFSLKMDKDKSCTATFESTIVEPTTTVEPQIHTLTVILSPEGEDSLGTVTSEPSGIDCGATCSKDFKSGKKVTLTATANKGSTFEGWAGCSSKKDKEITVTMDSAQDCTATFAGGAVPTSYILTISTTGVTDATNGRITIESSDGTPNINCDIQGENIESGCTADYKTPTRATLKLDLIDGFDKWECKYDGGDTVDNLVPDNPDNIIMTQVDNDISCVAVFKQ